MELSLLLMEQIAALFVIMAIGYGIVKIRFLEAEDSRVLSQILVYVCTPCVMIDAFQIEYDAGKVKGLLLAGAAALAVHAAMILFARLIRPVFRLNAIEEASVVYSNAGNLVIPLVAAVLGKEWVFYTSAYLIVQTVLFWTHGITTIGGKGRAHVKEVLLNPNILVIGVGLILFIGQIRLPEILAGSIESLGDMIGPGGMLVIGMLIGNTDLAEVFRRKKVYLICLLRLFVIPVLAAGALAFLCRAGLHKDAEYIFLVVLLATSGPAAAMVTQLSQICGEDAEYAGIINVMSVIFCIVTMPLMVMLYELGTG